MSDSDISNRLLESLLGTVKAYKPVYGEAFHISPAMEAAFRQFPRHRFIQKFRLISEMWSEKSRSQVDSDAAALIYSNQPLMYVGDKNQTLQASSSEPAFIMQLLSGLDVRPGDRVLEIGCGTGWLLAMMASLSRHPERVHGIEIVPDLVRQARVNLDSVGLGSIGVHLGDGNKPPSEVGRFERIMYTASTFEFPAYLFDFCEMGGRVVIPMRNRGLAEEVQLLDRVPGGFKSVAARLCKFVQMTQPFGNDLSSIQPLDEAVRHRLLSADVEPLDIPGGPPGALAFSSFMSKTEASFRVVGLADPKISPAFSAGVFGDPSAIGLAVVSTDLTAGAIWNQGVLRSFGDNHFGDRFKAGVSTWIECGQPVGAEFRLDISEHQPPPKDGGTWAWDEVRGGLHLRWSLAR